MLGRIFRWLLAPFVNETGAFAATFTPFAGSNFSAAGRTKYADQTATTSVTNTGIAGLRFARVRVSVKTFGTLTAGDTFRATLQVGTSTAITSPENICQYNGVVETGDVALEFEMFGTSQNGFQSFKVIFTAGSGHSFTADVDVYWA